MSITELATLAQIDLAQPGNAIFVALNDLGGGKLALDVRRWYVGDDEEWHPTGKGISIPAQLAATVVKALTDGLEREDVQAAIGAALKPKTAPTKKAVSTKRAAPKKPAARKAV